MSLSPTEIEHRATLAWSFGHLDPRGEHGPTRLLRRLVCDVELVSRAVPAGRVILDLTHDHCDHGPSAAVRHDPCLRPTRAKVARDQRPEDMVMAGARGCAMFTAWALAETWTQAELEATALAIVMPTGVLVGTSWTVGELAEYFGVDEHLVHQRLRMLGVSRGSGERPAMRAS